MSTLTSEISSPETLRTPKKPLDAIDSNKRSKSSIITNKKKIGQVGAFSSGKMGGSCHNAILTAVHGSNFSNKENTNSNVIALSHPTSNTKETLLTHNHLECFYHLSNKKALLYNMKSYYEAIGQEPFKTLPMTFHIKDGIADKEFLRFEEFFRTIDRLED
jgi:hypothetical protein